jgi:hypothetical protein
MPYCVNCGNKYTGVRNYCEKCGHMVGAEPNMTPLAAQGELLATAVERGTNRAYENRRKRGEIKREHNEALEWYLGSIGLVATFHGLTSTVPSIAKLLDIFGWYVFGLMALGALFKVAYDVRFYGKSLSTSLLYTLLLGAATYAVTYGVVWYISETIMHSGGSLFTFNFPTPVPKVILTPTRLR